MKSISFKPLIIFEDDNYFIVNKPPFVSTLEDRNDPVNMLALAKDYWSDAQACHRLDKDTSGILVFAKNPEAYRHLAMQFEGRSVEKIYHAVADGIHQFKDREVNAPIQKLDIGVVKISKEGKAARTIFNSIESYKNHTLIECRPITGRMHQIRIHLSISGAPITGDETYHGKPFYVSSVKSKYNLKKLTEEQPLMKRMALHSHKIVFKSLDGIKIEAEASYPKDLQALIRQLKAHKR
ncbi:MAG: pseudouridine synthase [Flammeovirgaceae bacterium]|nr:pseudouridine synthase [Flammeovirgaceae bacterium]